jgi:hypothetical protein
VSIDYFVFSNLFIINNIMAFIEMKPDLQQWDVDRIVIEIKSLLETNGLSWETWSQKAIVRCDWQSDAFWPEMNLTTSLILSKSSMYEKLFRYCARRFSESTSIDDNDLYIMHSELNGTYTGELISYLQNVFGPIRVRLHNRVDKVGLYWHKDAHAPIRYHLALWTNPGSFLVWTDEKLKWSPTFDPEQSKKDFKIHAQFIPQDGQIYAIETGKLVHGVANIGVGWQQRSEEQSRCHLTFWPVKPKESS